MHPIIIHPQKYVMEGLMGLKGRIDKSTDWRFSIFLSETGTTHRQKFSKNIKCLNDTINQLHLIDINKT